MKLRLPEMVPAPTVAPFSFPVELCSRCRRDVLPQRAVNSLNRDMWRAPAKGMAQKPDPKAERIKSRKEKKRSLRAITKEIGIVGAVTLVLRARATPPYETSPASDDCPSCAKLQRARLARFAA